MFVEGLPFDMTTEKLCEYFDENCGPIKQVRYMTFYFGVYCRCVSRFTSQFTTTYLLTYPLHPTPRTHH